MSGETALFHLKIGRWLMDIMTIDRIDNDGNYEPSYCRWATQKQQVDNRSITLYFEHCGKRKTLDAWSKELDIPYGTLYARIFRYKWEIQRALTTPLRIEKSHRKGAEL